VSGADGGEVLETGQAEWAGGTSRAEVHQNLSRGYHSRRDSLGCHREEET
jgi:hypothetical protein